MKILLDEGVPKQLTYILIGHEVTTVPDAGWASVKNGKLLSLVEAAGVRAFISCDKNMEHQQHELGQRSFAVFLLSTNHWPSMQPHVMAIVQALNHPEPGTVVRVECGRFVPRKFRKPSAS